MENNNRRALRLPEFWVTDSVAWFAHVEAHFELENLTSQQHRYFNVVKSLSQDSLRLIKDILANPHPTTPNDILKDRLLNNHSLTDFQKIERQFKMGELGPQQKPSELLAHLVELTPANELESKYLIFLFIRGFPRSCACSWGTILTWIYGIFRRERIACGLYTPTTWRRLSWR
jgi:hypothetical protein